jgi:hypothetical protein
MNRQTKESEEESMGKPSKVFIWKAGALRVVKK